MMTEKCPAHCARQASTLIAGRRAPRCLVWIGLSLALTSPAGCDRVAARVGAPAAEPPLPVRVAPVEQRVTAERVRSRAAIRSRTVAAVAARVAGILEEVPVDEGDAVVAGKTVMFRTDPTDPSAALEAVRSGLEVALRGVDEANAAEKAALAAEAKARLDRERMHRLLAAGRSVTQDTVETADVAWKAAAADVERARAAVGLAQARVEEARQHAAIAAKRLADCTVLAPMDGVVRAKLRERGEMGEIGGPVFSVEDPDHLEAAAFFESSLYPRLIAGKTELRLIWQDNEIYRGALSWKSPSIRDDLRVFEVRLYLPESDRRATSGELLTMEALLDPHEALMVPAESTLLRGEKTFIVVVRDGKAHRVSVECGVIDGKFIDVRSTELAVGDQVVVQGQEFLAEGRAVRVVDGEEG